MTTDNKHDYPLELQVWISDWDVDTDQPIFCVEYPHGGADAFTDDTLVAKYKLISVARVKKYSKFVPVK